MKTNQKKKRIFFKIAAVFLALAFNFFLPATPKANAWDAVMGAFVKRSLDTIYDTIKGIQLGILKQQAVTSLNQEMNFLLSGSSSGGAMFITDWRDFLIKQPEAEANRYLNDYLSQVTSGRGMSSYIPNNSEGFGNGLFSMGLKQSNPGYAKFIEAANAGVISDTVNSGGNYIQQLVTGAKRSTIDRAEPQVTYFGDPSRMFAEGNFRNMSLYLSGINNPWAFNLNAQQKYQEELEKKKEEAKTMGIAYQGFVGKIQDGKVLNPGSLIKENVANVQDLGNKIIAGAQNIPEVLTAVVSQMITKSIQQGIGTIQRSVHKEVSNVRSQAQTQMNNAISQQGPGALYQRR